MGNIIRTFRKIEKAISGEKSKPTPRKSVNRSQSLESRLEKYDGQYITFLNEQSNSGLYGSLRKSLNSTSATPLDQFVNAMCFRAEAVNEGFLTLAKAGNF